MNVMDKLEEEYIEAAMKADQTKEQRRIAVASRDMFQYYRKILEENPEEMGTSLKVFLAAAVEILAMAIAMTEGHSGAITKITTDGIIEMVGVMRPKFDEQRVAIRLLTQCLQAGGKFSGS